jgi:DNA-binding CsgD family transcriptional regulator
MFVPQEEGPLTPRLLDHLRSLAEGHAVSETAALLWLSPEGVKSARRVLYAKLGARNAAHAVHLAHQKGVLP